MHHGQCVETKKQRKKRKTSATWWLVLHFCLFWLNILLSLHVVWLHLTTFCWWVTQNWLKYSTFLLLIKDIFVDPGEQVPSKWTFVSHSWQSFQICSHIFSCSDVLITMVLINPITHIQLIYFFLCLYLIALSWFSIFPRDTSICRLEKLGIDSHPHMKHTIYVQCIF